MQIYNHYIKYLNLVSHWRPVCLLLIHFSTEIAAKLRNLSPSKNTHVTQFLISYWLFQTSTIIWRLFCINPTSLNIISNIITLLGAQWPGKVWNSCKIKGKNVIGWVEMRTPKALVGCDQTLARRGHYVSQGRIREFLVGRCNEFLWSWWGWWNEILKKVGKQTRSLINSVFFLGKCR